MDNGQRLKFDELVENRYRALHAQARARVDDDDIDQLIHDQRVALKRLRALWQLAKPTVGSTLPGVANRRLRNTARALGPARDARVADSTLDEIIKSTDDLATRDAISKFKALLGEIKPETSEDTVDDALQTMFAVLDEDAAAWRVYLEQADGKTLMKKGLRRTYRKAQQWALDAAATGDPEMAHRWRRWVKYLRYQLELFGEDAPEWVAHYRNRVRKLGQMLGSRNDLATLRTRLKVAREKLDADEYKRIAKTLKKREKTLDRKCQRLGRQIFDEPTGRFISRIEKAFAEWQKSKKPRLTVIKGGSDGGSRQGVA